MDNVILALGMDDSSIRMDALSILVYIQRNNHFKKTLADNDKLTAALVHLVGVPNRQTRLEHSGSEKEKSYVSEIFTNVKKYFKVSLNQQSMSRVPIDLYNQKRTENKYYRYDVRPSVDFKGVDHRNRRPRRV